MAEKVTKMSIKVDLQCWRCYKKIKKVLCKFPQIQDQKYDEKQNTVLITVVCCNPEKIRQTIICKGGKTVQGVEILTPEKPKPSAPPSPKPVPGLPVPAYPMVGVCCCPPCYGKCGWGPCYCGCRRLLMCSDGCGRPACECQCWIRSCCVSRCDYFSEDNATGCTVM